MHSPVFLALVCSAAIPTFSWENDYRLALDKASKAGKPLAVFIGSGRNGWSSVSGDGELSAEVRQLLATHYVCLYVDASDAKGKRVADSFDARRLPTLVLSDRRGAYQAYRHSGALENGQLASVLRQHNGDTPVESPVVVRSSYYQPVNSPPIICRG